MKFLIAFLLVFASAAQADIRTSLLVTNKTTTGAGSTFNFPMGEKKACQAYGTTTAGSGASVVRVEGSNDDTNYVALGSITLTLGVTSTTDGFAIDAGWKYMRGYVVSISGTNATVSLLCSYNYPGVK